MKKICFIINPIAGGTAKDGIVELIDSRLDRSLFEWEIRYTEGPGDATRIARDCDAQIVCAVGGDGTQNEVARGLIGTDKAMAIIPCGSGDGFALHLGISRNHRKAVESLNQASELVADTGLLDGETFLCTCGMGIDAIVSWRFANSGSRGLKTYIKEALKTWKGFKAEHYRLDLDGNVWEGDASIISIGNANQWGNNARITPLASVRDGFLDVTVVKRFKTWNIPGLVFRLMTGSIDKSRFTDCYKVKELSVVREKEGPFHFDGDPGTKGTDIEIKVAPSSLKLFVKAKNINRI